MASSTYRTAPVASDRIPSGIPFIISNEFAERFSFYGMKTILVIFMTQHLKGAGGELDVMTEQTAMANYHYFTGLAYAFPVMGALLSDIVFGKYPTIIMLSLVYCLGHLALAIDDTRIGLFVGLGLIAVGAGGIKPCVSAHVGDQFGQTNQHLLSRVFGWFYFSINAGSFVSTLLTPWLLDQYGPSAAFGVPGVLMFAATIVFWMGRHRFVHIPPGGAKFVKEAFGPEGRAAVGKLVVLFLFVSVFWSLFDQTGSSWVLQARDMNLVWLGHEWLPSQIQAANPLLIMVFIPLFNFVVYPYVGRYVTLTPMRKISVGLFVTSVSFLIPVWVESAIVAGQQPSIAWHWLAYIILTAAEVMVSITCLEFYYTQAPKTMKSFISALFWLSVTVGNFFAGFVNSVIENPDGTSKLEGPVYFLFFTGIMFGTAVLFVFYAMRYKEQRYLQDEETA